MDTEPKYKKKGGPDKKPAVVIPTAPIFEEVPIDVKQLSDAKVLLTEAEKLAGNVAQAGISVVKMIHAAAQIGTDAEKAEIQVREMLRQILTTHGVTANEFRGFDFDKGVIRIERQKDDAGTSREGA